MKKLILVRGLPGSGKTHWANSKCLCTDTAATVSADDFYSTNGVYRFDGAFLSAAHDYCKAKTHALLKDPTIERVYVHNTFSTKREVAPYVALAVDLGVCLEVYVMSGSVAECHSRNVHGVPRGTVIRMAERWQSIPTLDRYVPRSENGF